MVLKYNDWFIKVETELCTLFDISCVPRILYTPMIRERWWFLFNFDHFQNEQQFSPKTQEKLTEIGLTIKPNSHAKLRFFQIYDICTWVELRIF